MKYFNVILETTIPAENYAEAERFANENLSITDTNGEMFDVNECTVTENL